MKSIRERKNPDPYPIIYSMVTFPHCKINLGLHVLAKRPDGFHDIETLLFPLLPGDILEIVRSKEFAFSHSGLQVPGDWHENLCIAAYRALSDFCPTLAPVHIHLHKVIPPGSGLGGGSADAAFTLRLMNRVLGLGLSPEQKLACAKVLGSDCAFFLADQPCMARGRGEELEPVNFFLEDYKILLVCPPFSVSTRLAYSMVTPNADRPPLSSILGKPVEQWKNSLVNDFETPVFKAYPVLAEIKKSLYDLGALYASLSGSGSALYAIFSDKNIAIPEWRDGYKVFEVDAPIAHAPLFN